MSVAEVSVNVDEMETFINYALMQVTNDPHTSVSCVGNTVTLHSSRQILSSAWEERRLRSAVQSAIEQLSPGCEVVWKS